MSTKRKGKPPVPVLFYLARANDAGAERNHQGLSGSWDQSPDVGDAVMAAEHLRGSRSTSH